MLMLFVCLAAIYQYSGKATCNLQSAAVRDQVSPTDNPEGFHLDLLEIFPPILSDVR